MILDSNTALLVRYDQGKIDIELRAHHAVETEMFAGVAETFVGAACGQIFVGEKEQDRRSQSVAVVRLNDQYVFTVNDDLRLVHDVRPYDTPSCGNRFSYNNGRRFVV